MKPRPTSEYLIRTFDFLLFARNFASRGDESRSIERIIGLEREIDHPSLSINIYGSIVALSFLSPSFFIENYIATSVHSPTFQFDFARFRSNRG